MRRNRSATTFRHSSYSPEPRSPRMLSRSAEYALRGAVHLAGAHEGDWIPADAIAAALGAPRNYLSKLLNHLAATGHLDSQRGPRGGFRLARDPAHTPIGDIVAVFDPELINEEGRCLLGRVRCSDRTPCAAHHRWKTVQGPLRTFLRETTLRDLARSEHTTGGNGTAPRP